jgi:spore maturation protein CgeB
MFNIMQRSRITLNVHERSSANLAGNIRMFEATGSGTLLLTEAAPNLSQLFEPDKEVVTYRSAEEAVSKVRYYLQNLSECEAIARAGQQRTLRCHSARVRANEILQIFGDLLGSA